MVQRSSGLRGTTGESKSNIDRDLQKSVKVFITRDQLWPFYTADRTNRSRQQQDVIVVPRGVYLKWLKAMYAFDEAQREMRWHYDRAH